MPMTQTLEITTYSYQELSPKAKQVANDKLAPNDYEWWDYIYEQATEDGDALGFDIDRIYFTGFYSQGDGACWQGRVDTQRWLELNRPDDVNAHLALALIENGWLAKSLEINLVSSRYSHSNTMNHAGWEMVHPTEDHVLDHGVFAGTNVQHLFDTLGMGYFEDVAIDILASTRDYADDIYRLLRDEYDRLCSEEVIAELCEANEYRFDEQGNLI